MLDIFVQSRCDAKAAERFFREPLRGLRYVSRVIVTDEPRGYAAAKREILSGVEHRQSRYLDNRAAVSHQPTRTTRTANAAVPLAHGRIHNPFQLRRHRLTTDQHCAARDTAFRTWREVAGVAPAA